MTCNKFGSHNRLDLLQNLVPRHYVCNWYIFNFTIAARRNAAAKCKYHSLNNNVIWRHNTTNCKLDVFVEFRSRYNEHRDQHCHISEYGLIGLFIYDTHTCSFRSVIYLTCTSYYFRNRCPKRKQVLSVASRAFLVHKRWKESSNIVWQSLGYSEDYKETRWNVRSFNNVISLRKYLKITKWCSESINRRRV